MQIKHLPHTLLLVSIVAVASLSYSQEQPPDDFDDNATRTMCISAAYQALPVIGDTFDAQSDTMIHAHTLRTTALSCFITINQASYLIVLSADGGFTEGFVVKYDIDEFSSFSLD